MTGSVTLIDYGCHSFTFRLAARLLDGGYQFRYFANGSLESPNLDSLPDWSAQYPELVRVVSCPGRYGKMSLRDRLVGEQQWASRCIAALKDERPSAIICSCVPLSVIWRIHLWARRSSTPLIYWLQDLQGRAIGELLSNRLGVLGRAAGGLAESMERQVLERSRFVITIAPGHERVLPDDVFRSGRYGLLENWANIEDIPVLPVANEWSERQGLNRTLNVVYAGTLGWKHDLSVFFELAAAFKQRTDIRIVIVSGGQAAAHVKEAAREQGFHHLQVLPFQPHQEFAKVLGSASVLVAPLDPSAGTFCVPSKVLAYHCAGRPTVLAINSANPAAKMIKAADSGSIVTPRNSQEFVAQVGRLLDDAPMRRRQGANARRYAENTFLLDAVMTRFLKLLAQAEVSPNRLGANGTLAESKPSLAIHADASTSA